MGVFNPISRHLDIYVQWTLNMLFENHRKCLILQYCKERSELQKFADLTKIGAMLLNVVGTPTILKMNLTRSARNVVKCDFWGDFQTLCHNVHECKGGSRQVIEFFTPFDRFWPFFKAKINHIQARDAKILRGEMNQYQSEISNDRWVIFNMYFCCNLLSRPHTNAFAAVEEKKEGTKNEELQNHLILPLLSALTTIH